MTAQQKRPLAAALYGAPIGALGGLIELGGAEFRLGVASRPRSSRSAAIVCDGGNVLRANITRR